MSVFTSIQSSLIQVGKGITQSLWQIIKDNFDYFNTKISTLEGQGTPNGSFEIDADKDDIPDTWTRGLYTGGDGGLSPSQVIGTDGLNYTCSSAHTAASGKQPITGGSWGTYWAQKGNAGCTWITGKHYKALAGAHGERCTWLEHPGGGGNGGGYWDSDYEACDQLVTRVRSFKLLANTGASLNVKVQHIFYDKDKVVIGTTTDVYSYTANPTTWTQFRYQFVPPANARFMKVRLIGGYNDTDPGSAQTVYFDDVRTEKAVTQTDIFKPSIGQAELLKPSVGQAELKTSSPNYLSGSGPAIIILSAYAFFPNIANTVGDDSYPITPWLSGGNPNDSTPKFRLGGGAVAYFINYRCITASFGEKVAVFRDAGGLARTKYYFNDAPPDWATVFQSMATDNGWTYELITKEEFDAITF